jgi:hypothetical protein
MSSWRSMERHSAPRACSCPLGVLLVALLVSGTTTAQDGWEPVHPDSVREQAKNFRFTPFVAPSYSPEMKVLISGGGVSTFRLDPTHPDLRLSSATLSVGYSTNRSFIVYLKPFLYMRQDHWRLSGELEAQRMPDNYWGIGYDAALRAPAGDTTTHYERNYLRVFPKLVGEVAHDLFVGGGIDYVHTRAEHMNSTMAMDPAVQQYGSDVTAVGALATVQYDTRDLAVNAYRGILIDLTWYHYTKAFGGQYAFDVFELDHRGYKRLGPHRHILAYQFYWRGSSDGTPWSNLTMIGRGTDLRGYRFGRFRDRSGAFLLAEYRHMFQRRTPDRKGSYESRSGVAVWTGLGTVSPRSVLEFDNFMPNVGFGYRFEVQPRMNMRADLGIGRGSFAAYVTFSEVF